MKNFVLSFVFAALSSFPLLADAKYVFVDYRPLHPNSEVFDGMDVDISPYAGWVGGNAGGSAGNHAVLLFCDDYADNAAYYAGWAVNVTPVDSGDFSDTRFGAANPNPASATGRSLYRELAWLFTQTMLRGQSTANQDAIQEAAWAMTNGTDETPGLTGAAAAPDMSYRQWIAAAESSYEQVATGYATPQYGNWLILTDTRAAGNPRGAGNQEFLAYSDAGGSAEAFPSAGEAPEPTSFLLCGAGLFGLIRLRGKVTRTGTPLRQLHPREGTIPSGA